MLESCCRGPKKVLPPSGLLTEVIWFTRAVSIGNDGVDLFNFWVVLFVCLIMATISVVVASGGIGGVIVWALSVRKGATFSAIHHGFDGDSHLYWGLFQRPCSWGRRCVHSPIIIASAAKNWRFLVDSTSAPIAGSRVR